MIIRHHKDNQHSGRSARLAHNHSRAKSHMKHSGHKTSSKSSTHYLGKHKGKSNRKLYDRHGKPRKAFTHIPLIPVLTIPPPGVDPIFNVHTFANTLLPFKWMAPLIGVNVQPMPIKNGDLTIKLPRIKNPVVIDEFPTYQTISQPPSNHLDASGQFIR